MVYASIAVLIDCVKRNKDTGGRRNEKTCQEKLCEEKSVLVDAENKISDIPPLMDNEGCSEGDEVNLTGNPLSTDSANIYIPQLGARGVIVEY